MLRSSLKRIWGRVLATDPQPRPRRRRRLIGGVTETLEDRTLLSAFAVVSTIDSPDANPGDGTAADANGNATLRAAIMEANALPGADTITLVAGTYQFSIAGTNEDFAATGDLDVRDDLTIEGAGEGVTIIDARLLDRAFELFAGANLTLRGVTIQWGRAPVGGGIASAGYLTIENSTLASNRALYRGGAIDTTGGSLTVRDVVFNDNLSDDGSTAPNSLGGAIALYGTDYLIEDTVFQTNSAAATGGAISARSSDGTVVDSIFNNVTSDVAAGAIEIVGGTLELTGGGFFNVGSWGNGGGGVINAVNVTLLTVSGSSFAEVAADGSFADGGVVRIASGNAVLTDNQFLGAYAGRHGGAIYNAGNLTAERNVIGNNSAVNGGGLYNAAGATATLINNTFAEHHARGLGGAIYNEGTLNLVNNTIADNTTTSGGGGVWTTGLSAVVQAQNNIIARNTDGRGHPDVFGTYQSLGGNLIGRIGFATGFTQPTDQVGTSTAPIDPLLGPLADQGGFIWLMPLLPGSPAIDRGVLSGAPTTDHRGLPRPYGGGVDIGSFELQDSAPVAQNGSASVNEDSLVEGQVVATDPEGSTLTFSLVDAPQHGTAFVAGDGSFLYIPAADYNGSDQFTFKASDGGFDSNVATIAVTVRPVNDLPLAAGQNVTTDEDTEFSGTVTGSDIDGDTLTFSVVADPAHGSVSLQPDGSFVYTPEADFHGTDSFTFRANDGQADSNTATVSITVDPVNDTPTIANAQFTIAENSAAGTPVGAVSAGDADADALTYAIIGGNTGGAFDIDVNTGAITVANAAALDFETTPQFSLTVQVTDPGNLSATATVTISLTDVDETLIVPIDIVPGDPDNVISLKDGKVQVAILSTATFDAQQVDVESLRFGPTGTENSLLRHRKHGTPQVSYSDVNGDGRLDLVAWFDVAVLGLQEGSVELTLTGRLLDGTSIRGSGMAMVVAGKGRGRR